MMGVSGDLSGWQLAGGIAFTFSNGTVMTGGANLVVAKTPGAIAGALGPFTGVLSNSGDTIRIVNNSGRIMDTLTYSDHCDWPVAADGGGVSLAKRDPFLASDTAASWTASSQTGGTPGAVNFPPPPGPVTVRMINPRALGNTTTRAQRPTRRGRRWPTQSRAGAAERRVSSMAASRSIRIRRRLRRAACGMCWRGRAMRTREFPRRKATRTKSA